jgi:type IV secretion system protein VirB9
MGVQMMTPVAPAVEFTAPMASEPLLEEPQAVISPSPAFSPAAESARQKRNFNYTLSGPEALAPIQVFDDGMSTYMRFETEVHPKVTVVGSGNQEFPVAVRSEDGFLVVDVVVPTLLLRDGRNFVQIYNEALTHAGRF